MSVKTADSSTPIRWRGAFQLTKNALKEWSDDKAPRLGAALSYYTVFAIAPVLLVAISVAGLVFGKEAAQGEIMGQLRSMFGPETAAMVQDMLAKSAARGSGIVGTVVGIATLVLGATAVMIELESALDVVWKVKPKPGLGIRGLIKDRILSLGLVLSLGFLLLVSLVASAVLGALGGLLEKTAFPGASVVGQILNNLVSLGVITMFFALIFRYLPNAKIAWRDVWVGALVTSGLFHVGKIGIGIYLGHASIGSTFGAAGSLAVLLVWVYYTAQIVLFGAEITRLYAERYGHGVKPDADAVRAPRAAEVATGALAASGRPAANTPDRGAPAPAR
jgi:membrane protein